MTRSVGSTKPNLPVQAVRVTRVQDPAHVRQRPALDHLSHELDPEPAAAVLGQDVHVGEIHE